MSKRKLLRIGITMGDIHGVGPELLITALQEKRLLEMFTPIIYGSPRVLNIFRKVLSVEKFSYNIIDAPNQAQPKKVSVVNCTDEVERVDIGVPDPMGGKIAFQALERAVSDLKADEIDALVTLPIDKASMQSDQFQFPGHTEYLSEAFGVEDSLMLMVHENLRIGVATGHVPLKNVSKKLGISHIVSKIRIMERSLRIDFNIERPKIAVLGLNPHAGDNGLLGKEEREYIGKALEQLGKDRKHQILALGPYPADGFFGMGSYKKFDGILAMYHDQGLIPFKLMAGLYGVNYTAGLPIVRTSPDHGVAYDVAGKGIADPTSMIQAIYAAIDIVRARHENEAIEAESLKNSTKKAVQVGSGEDEDVAYEEEGAES